MKRILVGLGTSSHAESVVSHAIEIAQMQGAELLGVAVVDPSRLEWTGPRPIGVGVETLTAELRQDRMTKVAAEIEKANKLFAEKCSAAKVPHQTCERTGDPFEIVADLVRYQDQQKFLTKPVNELVIHSKLLLILFVTKIFASLVCMGFSSTMLFLSRRTVLNG